MSASRGRPGGTLALAARLHETCFVQNTHIISMLLAMRAPYASVVLSVQAGLSTSVQPSLTDAKGLNVEAELSEDHEWQIPPIP